MPRTALIQYIHPGAGIDSNFPDFVADHHRVFRPARTLETLACHTGKNGQDCRLIYYRRRIGLSGGKRTVELAVGAGQRHAGFYVEINTGRAALCTAVTPVMDGIYRR